MPVVGAGYGPTLPEMLGARRWRVVRAAAVVVAVVGAILLLVKPGEESRSTFDVRGPGGTVATFDYQAPLRPASSARPATVEERRGDVFVQSMTVSALALPAYRGDVGGELPLVADRFQRRLAARHADFELVDEGRARIKNNPGYAFSWTARVDGRRLFGHDYLLVHEDAVAPRSGFHLKLRATYAAGVASGDDVGRIGPLRLALHTFSFDPPA